MSNKILPKRRTADATAPTAGQLDVGELAVNAFSGALYTKKQDGTVVNLTASGPYTGAPLTMATARLLGRTTASTGAAEEISVGAGLSLSAGSLTLASAINPSSIGATTPGTGAFTTLTTTGVVAIGGSTTANYAVSVLNGLSGADTRGVQVNCTHTKTANSQQSFGITNQATLATGTYTSLRWFGVYSATPSLTGTGSLIDSYGLYIEAAPAATTKYGIWQDGVNDVNRLRGTLQVDGAVGLGGATAAGICTYLRHAVSASGGNGVELYIQPTYNYAANNEQMFAAYVTGSLAKSTYTGLYYYGLLLNQPSTSGTGTIANAYQLYIAACPSATNAYGIYQNGTDQNYLKGKLTVENSAASAAYNEVLAMRYTGSATNGTGMAVNIFTTGGTQVGRLGWATTGSGQNLEFEIWTYVASTHAKRVTVGNGIQVGAPTGGDTGAGTINCAADIYKNNTAYTNPDYVLEHWATGRVEKFAHKEGAKEYAGLKPIAEVETFMRSNWHLPRFGQKANHGIFSGSDALLASVEEAYLYIIQLEKRIRDLEARQAA